MARLHIPTPPSSRAERLAEIFLLVMSALAAIAIASAMGWL
ncbi:hypothetical protein [Roseococcus sp.]